MRSSAWVATALIAFLASCTGDDEVLVDATGAPRDAAGALVDSRPTPDGATTDADTTDADTTDADTTDADTTDADTTDADTTDADTTDADTTDAVPSDAAPADALTCNNGACPSPGGTPVAGQQVVIQSVDIGTNEITIRNVSGGSLNVSGWSLCQGPGLYETIPNVAAMADGGTATIAVTNGLGLSSELGIYETGDFTSSTDIRAYVRWGATDNMTPSVRESVAIGATPPLWSVSELVDLTCPGAGGFVATGNVHQGAGFTVVQASCL